jgi:hypothetical protein
LQFVGSTRANHWGHGRGRDHGGGLGQGCVLDIQASAGGRVDLGEIRATRRSGAEEAEGPGQKTDAGGGYANPLAVGLDMDRAGRRGGGDGEIGCFGVKDEGSAAALSEPGAGKPGGDADPARRADSNEAEVRVMDVCGGGEGMEEAAERIDADGHGGDRGGRVRDAVRVCPAEVEGRKAVGGEDSGGVEIVGEPAEAVRGAGKHEGARGSSWGDESSVGACAGEDGEVAGLRGGLDLADRDDAGRKGEDLAGGGERVGREAEVTGEGVGRAHGDDAEGRAGLGVCRVHTLLNSVRIDHPLQGIVDGAVSPAGEDEFGALCDSVAGLRAGGSGGGGRECRGLIAVGGKKGTDLPDGLRARRVVSARDRVVEQEGAHKAEVYVSVLTAWP